MVKEKEEQEKGEGGEEKEKKMYKCKWLGCDAEFERTVDLARHVRLEHKLKKEEPEPESEETKEEIEEKPAEEIKEEAEPEKEIPEEKAELDMDIAKEVEKEEKVEEIKEVPEVKVGLIEPKEEEEKRIVSEIEIRTPPPESVDITSTGAKLHDSQPPIAAAGELNEAVLKMKDIAPPIEKEYNYSHAKQIRDKYGPLLLNYPNVTGISMGRTMDGRPAIEILVCVRCPEHDDIPETLDGVPIIIREVGGVEINPARSPEAEKESITEEEKKETLIDKVAHTKKLGIFFEGPIRKSIRKWLKRRREEKGERSK